MSFISEVFRNQENINKELIEAAHSGSLKRAQKALLAGADSKTKNQALAIAVRFQRKEMAFILLGNGGDPNSEAYSDSGLGLNRAVLTEAASQADLPMADALLAGGAEINHQSKDGLTPLICAVHALPSRKAGCLAIIKVFLAIGADPNRKAKDGQTALMRAAGDGWFEAAKILLDQGADPNLKTHLGMTAYNHATLYNHHEVADLLVKHGADPNPFTPSSSAAAARED